MLGLWLVFQILQAAATALPSAPKMTYVIGGYIADQPDVFLRLWKPVLEDYLTSVVGPQYDPPIEFKLIAADFTEETRIETLIQDGLVDFVCE